MTKPEAANKKAQRWLHRQLRKVMKRDSGRCSLCHKDFPHNSQIYGGVMTDRSVAIVGSCCRSKLEWVGVIGVHVSYEDAWKADDAAWFKANPKRSHRLRPAFLGELATHWEFEAMPHHETQFVIRQLKPGQRIKTVFYRDARAPTIPDDEAIIHALCDILAASDHEGKPVSAGQIVELAEKYAVKDDAKLN
jgi:hypothetical protein